MQASGSGRRLFAMTRNAACRKQAITLVDPAKLSLITRQ
jgi:hypothetical protein